MPVLFSVLVIWMLCGMYVNLRYSDPRTFCSNVHVPISIGNATQIMKIREVYLILSKVLKYNQQLVS